MKSNVVLVAEDDSELASIYAITLERGGYRVLTAADGDEALTLIEGEPSIGLVLSDVVMPRMGGRELAWRVRQLRPEVHVILSSGYATAEGALQSLSELGVEFLPKPVDLSRITDIVRSKLGPAGR